MNKFLIFNAIVAASICICFGASADNTNGKDEIMRRQNEQKPVISRRYEVNEEVQEEEEEILRVNGEETGFGKRLPADTRSNQANLNQYGKYLEQQRYPGYGTAELSRGTLNSGYGYQGFNQGNQEISGFGNNQFRKPYLNRGRSRPMTLNDSQKPQGVRYTEIDEGFPAGAQMTRKQNQNGYGLENVPPFNQETFPSERAPSQYFLQHKPIDIGRFIEFQKPQFEFGFEPSEKMHHSRVHFPKHGHHHDHEFDHAFDTEFLA